MDRSDGLYDARQTSPTKITHLHYMIHLIIPVREQGSPRAQSSGKLQREKKETIYLAFSVAPIARLAIFFLKQHLHDRKTPLPFSREFHAFSKCSTNCKTRAVCTVPY